MASELTHRNISMFLIIGYLWILVANPQARFPILGEIRLERIVMLSCWIVSALSHKIIFKSSKITGIILLLYASMIISYMLSPYKGFFISEHWLENYWKFIVLYFLVLFSINRIDDICYLFVGLVVILFIYQAHSWYDFLYGGSYVWQQGIKRMVGIWSGGIGAANYLGMISLFSLPFAVFWYQVTNVKKLRLCLIGYFVMTFGSIAFSGTRGAMLGLLFFVIINIRKKIHFKVASFFFLFIAGVLVFGLPDYLKQRYFGLIWSSSEKKVGISDRAFMVSRESAEARLKGLIEGWELVKMRPLFGHGPGSSALARKQVNEELRYNDDANFQMHNLYGQVMAETGFLGTILFVIAILVYFWELSKIKPANDDAINLNSYKLALQNSMLLFLFYGIASHTLYRYQWFLLFACHGAFVHIVSKRRSEKANDKELSTKAIQGLRTTSA